MFQFELTILYNIDQINKRNSAEQYISYKKQLRSRLLKVPTISVYITLGERSTPTFLYFDLYYLVVLVSSLGS